MGAVQAKHRLEVLCENSSEDSRPTPLAHIKGGGGGREENEEEPRAKGKPANGWVHQHQVGAVKAFQRVLCLILLGFGVANGESEEAGNFNAPYDRKRSLSRSPRGERRPMEKDGWHLLNFVKWRLEEGVFRQEKRKEKQPGRGPKDL